MELVLILAVALIVVGPAKLPEVGSALGKTMREFRKSMQEMQSSVDDVVKEKPRSQPETSSQSAAASEKNDKTSGTDDKEH